MSIRLRAALLVCLTAAAAYLGVRAVAGVAPAKDEVPDYYVQGTASPADTAFVLRDCGGYIGIYSSMSASSPESVTNISTAGLRAADRKLLEKGIPVSGRDELLTLLEDFGS